MAYVSYGKGHDIDRSNYAEVFKRYEQIAEKQKTQVQTCEEIDKEKQLARQAQRQMERQMERQRQGLLDPPKNGPGHVDPPRSSATMQVNE